MTTESTATMPMLQHLSPVKIEPTRSSKISLCLVFLEKIDRIEINSTKEHDGVVYYVLDVFLKHSTSHIPTIKMTTASANGGQPDYQLERRFNDFANLRYEVWLHAQHRHVGPCTCAYCNAFMKYIELSISQPRLFVKLGAGVNTRKVLMTRFCNAFIAMTIGGKTETWPRDIECGGSQSIPRVIARFFRRGEA